MSQIERNTPVFINPFTDFGFKKIFGQEANKDLLIDFLNELLASEGEKISELSYKKNDRLGNTGVDRNVVFDLFCENEKGEKFTVELQKAKQSFFKDRMVYYSSFSIQEQGQKGTDDQGKPWNYQLKAVYVIGILDFIIDKSQKDEIVVSHNKLMDIENNSVFYDKLSFVTIQMPNFKKSINELETNFDKWLYVIKNLERLDKVPEKLQNKIFQKLFNVAQYAAMSKPEQEAYEDSLKYYRDLYNVISTSKEDGIKEAEHKFVPLIEEAQRQKEEALAKEKKALANEKEAQIKLVKKMLKYGESIEEIMQETGLSEDEIKKLKL